MDIWLLGVSIHKLLENNESTYFYLVLNLKENPAGVGSAHPSCRPKSSMGRPGTNLSVSIEEPALTHIVN
jgi:hypothetical protein